MNLKRLRVLLEEALSELDEESPQETPAPYKATFLPICKYLVKMETEKAIMVDFIEPKEKLDQWVPKAMLSKRNSLGNNIETGIIPKWLLKEKNLI